MKSREEIDELYHKYWDDFSNKYDDNLHYYSFVEGYTQCQEDMAIEITELKMICKNIQNDFKALNDMLNSLNKQD